MLHAGGVVSGTKVWWEVELIEVGDGGYLLIGCGNQHFTSCDVSGAWNYVGDCANSYYFDVHYNYTYKLHNNQ